MFNKTRFNSVFLFFLVGILYIYPAYSLEVMNIDSIARINGLNKLSLDKNELKNIKVAVLDLNFDGFIPQGTPLLPRCTQFIPGPALFADANDPQVDLINFQGHGIRMAQLYYSALKSIDATLDPEECSPQIYLVEAGGYTNFKKAIDFIIQEKITNVIYSLNWEYGGNFDGTGIYNKEVNRAIEAGVKWFNAAGDYQNIVYDAEIKLNKNLEMPLIEFESLENENPVRIVLNWDDYSDDVGYATSDDLDISILDHNIEIGGSYKIQNGKPVNKDNPENSSFAREVVLLNKDVILKKQKYHIKITAKSVPTKAKNFRITLLSNTHGSLRFTNPSIRGEILIPADVEGTITVGDTSKVSSRGPTRDGRNKPDVLIKSSQAILLNRGRKETTFGTSEANAIMAAIGTSFQTMDPSFTTEDLKKIIQSKKIHSQEGCMQLIARDEFHREYEALIGVQIPHLNYIDSAWPIGKVVDSQTNQALYYVATPVSPQMLPPFNSEKHAQSASVLNQYSENEKVYLLGVNSSEIVHVQNASQFGSEFIRFVSVTNAPLLCIKSETPIWY